MFIRGDRLLKMSAEQNLTIAVSKRQNYPQLSDDVGTNMEALPEHQPGQRDEEKDHAQQEQQSQHTDGDITPRENDGEDLLLLLGHHVITWADVNAHHHSHSVEKSFSGKFYQVVDR